METVNKSQYFELFKTKLFDVASKYSAKLIIDLRNINTRLAESGQNGGIYINKASRYIEDILPKFLIESIDTIEKLHIELNNRLDENEWEEIEGLIKIFGNDLIRCYETANDDKILKFNNRNTELVIRVCKENIDIITNKEIKLLKSKITERLKKNDMEESHKSFMEDSMKVVLRNTEETLKVVKSMWPTLDLIINNMGRNSQKTTQENMEMKKLINEYIELIESKEPDNESKLKKFIDSLQTELAVTIFFEVGKHLLSFK